MDTASHSLVLLQQLNMQREFGFLCDCTVAIGDVYFKAHRAVLAAFSNYFKMIFIHQTRKRKITCTICGHKFLRKSQLLEHMYTHKGKSYRYNRCQRFGNALAQRFQPFCDSWSDVPLKSSRLSQEPLDSSCALESELTQENVDTILVE
uniref:Zinc finger and BTB domain containing 25 n=1 Tax=Equus caballus TaxID=9796 RepID=A0A9L0SHB3_HORSE